MQSPTFTVSPNVNKVTPHHEYNKLMYPWDRQVRCSNVTQYWPVPWTGRCQHLAYLMQSRGQWQFTAWVYCQSQHCSADANSDLHDESREHWIRLSWYYNDCFWMIKNTTSISLLQYNAMQLIISRQLLARHRVRREQKWVVEKWHHICKCDSNDPLLYVLS